MPYCNVFLKLVSRISSAKSEERQDLRVQDGPRSRASPSRSRRHKPKTLQEAMEVAVQAAPYINTPGKSGAFQFGRSSSFARGASSSSSSSAPMDINAVGTADDDQPEAVADPNAALMQSMLNKMEALEHRLLAISQPPVRATGARSGSSSSSSRSRVPGLSAADVARLMAEGRCFRCQKTGHIKNDCPGAQAASSSGARLNY